MAITQDTLTYTVSGGNHITNWANGARMQLAQQNVYTYTPPVTTAPISFNDFIIGTREGWLPDLIAPRMSSHNKNEILNKCLPNGTKVLFSYGTLSYGVIKTIGTITQFSQRDNHYLVNVEGFIRVGILGKNMFLLSSKEEIE